MPSIVIIGGGAGGLTAALECRRLYPDKPVTLIDREREIGYYRTLLPMFMVRTLGEEKLFFWKPGGDAGLDVRLGVGVRSVDTAGRRVVLEDGETLAYERLILAQGGRPVVPPVFGERPWPKGAFPVRSLEMRPQGAGLDRRQDAHRRARRRPGRLQELGVHAAGRLRGVADRARAAHPADRALGAGRGAHAGAPRGDGDRHPHRRHRRRLPHRFRRRADRGARLHRPLDPLPGLAHRHRLAAGDRLPRRQRTARERGARGLRHVAHQRSQRLRHRRRGRRAARRAPPSLDVAAGGRPGPLRGGQHLPAGAGADPPRHPRQCPEHRRHTDHDPGRPRRRAPRSSPGPANPPASGASSSSRRDGSPAAPWWATSRAPDLCTPSWSKAATSPPRHTITSRPAPGPSRPRRGGVSLRNAW